MRFEVQLNEPWTVVCRPLAIIRGESLIARATGIIADNPKKDLN
jgi:hypothetical protein